LPEHAEIAAPLSLRLAAQGDRALLFEWANDPVTRANSFTPDPVPWETHCSWLAGVLRDPHRRLYLVLGPGDEPVGQVRFDRRGEHEAEISMSLAPTRRGQGLAARVIRLATDRAKEDAGFQTVHAFIKPANEVSRRAFARAGYVDCGLVERMGWEAVHLRLSS